MKIHQLTSILAGLALAACGGDPTVQEVLDESINTQCSKAWECMATFPSGQGVTFEQLFSTSESACVTNFQTLIDEDQSKFEASVAAGRIIYNPDDAQICLDAMAALTCGQFWGTEPVQEPAACDSAFQGTVADGGMCTIDEDCAVDGSECGTTNTCGPA